MNRFNTKIGLLVVALTVGLFSVALAHNENDTTDIGDFIASETIGFGIGSHGPMKVSLTGENTDLSLEDATGLKQARLDFLKITRELRDKIEQQQFRLDHEFLKTNPEEYKPFDFQKELFEISSMFDRKVLMHQLDLDLQKHFLDTDLSPGSRHGRGKRWLFPRAK